MAWIYLAESEDSPRPWRPGCGRSPTVSMTDTPRQSYCRECQGEIYHVLPSGMMSGHSAKCSSLLEQLTSSMAASPVRTSVLRDVERAWTASAVDFIGSCTASSKSANQLSLFSKTSQRSAPVALSEWSGHLPISGMTVDGHVYQPQKLVPRTCAADGSYLPTPAAHRSGSSNNGKRPDGTTYKQAGKPSLDTMARKDLWPTPTAQQTGRTLEQYQQYVDKHRNGRSKPCHLEIAVQMWPTPTASGAKSGSPNNRYGNGDLSLAAAVVWRTPMASDWKNRCHGEGQQVHLQAQVGGQLNPTWVEWLMGYTSEWTVLKDWAMQWFLIKRGKRS